MKPENQNHDEIRGRMILQSLEGTISEKERKEFDREAKIFSEEIQEISKILELSCPRQELSLPANQIEIIAKTITKTAAIHPLRKRISARRLGFGLLTAAVLAIAFFQLFKPGNTTNLDWEATEFHTISQEIKLASVMLAENTWIEESQNSVDFSQKTENALFEAQLQLANLESSLSDSLFIHNQMKGL